MILPAWINDLADSRPFTEILRCKFVRQNHINVQARGRPVDPPTKPLPLWFEHLCKGDYRRFDVCVASSAVPKQAARWLRLLLLLGGDIERNPGPARVPRGPFDLSSGFAASTQHQDAQEPCCFLCLARAKFCLQFLLQPSPSEAMACISTRPVYCVICLSMPSPLALQDACPEYRNHLTPAWQIDKKWQLMEPVECRPVISKLILQAAVSSGLLWGWDDWVAVTLIGFIQVLTCVKLKGRVVRLKVYVCCTQQS